ncbi:MAG: prolyl oligopeptidase family serine peptidase [Thermoguttaceae bacterium]|nr:prolyl oligopeptidase family serine peptidase [Thermoguttaceae bacterium]MDW8079313.1 PHB depolymerase family esterase [Thermoguttaceae bacterium]
MALTSGILVTLAAVGFFLQLRAELADWLRRLDRNGDGRVSAEEVKGIQLLERVLSFADEDRDGMLSTEELRGALRRRVAQGGQGERSLSPPPPGVEQKVCRLTVDGRERSFIIQVPEKREGKLPVVFVFHGGGGQAENMLVRTNFGPLAAKEYFLVVYPNGWKNHWNDGRKAVRIASQQEGVDDVKFVRMIIEHLAKEYPIDRGRIFATGVSNGGIFCHYLAAQAADLFAAIAPVIGGLAEPVAKNFRPSHPISLLVIQGDADPLVPIAGGPIAGSDRGGRIISTEEMLTLYLAHNGIIGQPVEEPYPDNDPNDGCRVVVRRYPPGREGVKVEYWLIQGGGHTLPGSPRAGLRLAEAFVGKVCRDFDFQEVIWKFFQSCPARSTDITTPATK